MRALVCRLVLSVLLIVLHSSALGTCTVFASDKEELTVSAAISLKNAFEEIGRLFEAEHKESRVRFNFGASGDLMRQIEGGAPVDVFASASQKEMDDAEKNGFIAGGSRIDFAGNEVVLIVPGDSKLGIRGFRDLMKDEVRQIAVGNPKSVPAGRYAEQVFTYYKLTNPLRDKLVYAGNVRQVLDYVARGEVDAGVVYSTDARIRAKDVRIAATAPEGSHGSVVYPAAVVRGTSGPAMARAFVAFLTSAKAVKILNDHGFKLPGKAGQKTINR